MSKDSVTVPSATHMMVPVRVSISLTYRAPEAFPKNLESQPIQQTETEFPVLEMKAQGRGWNDVKPITSVMDS